ncbi:WG repeat-containing protein [Sphingobacterium faecale]|uniref:WG repeat-containing protein n=1 Tax=Sphingobacterium faecale TaxID=2803775 RepID=A0ABS1R823_9SPHI|nr:WG repeat-containing protein [Sphingobacterium faecale]MBL1410823.1 WG repeat-containing protein [Sphingobacterium faecale]
MLFKASSVYSENLSPLLKKHPTVQKDISNEFTEKAKTDRLIEIDFITKRQMKKIKLYLFKSKTYDKMIRNLTAILFLLFVIPVYTFSQVPNGLKGKWQGKLIMTKGDKTFEGDMMIGLGNWEAANASQVEFYLRNFTDKKQKYFKYVDVKYKSNEDIGFFLTDVFPTDENLSLTSGEFDFHLLQLGEDIILAGKYSAMEEGSLIQAHFSLVKKKIYDKLAANNPGLIVLKQHNLAVVNFYNKQQPTDTPQTNNTTVLANNPQRSENLNDDKSIRIVENIKMLDADQLFNFSDGYAVITKGSSHALINATGDLVIPYNKYVFSYAENCDPGAFDYNLPIKGSSWDTYGFKNGLLVAKDIQTGKYGVLNTKLEIVAPFTYDHLSGCSGHKVVSKNKRVEYLTYTRNLTRYEIEMLFNEVDHPDNLYKIKTVKVASAVHQVLNGYSDKAGNIKIEPKYPEAGVFNEGLAPVAKYDEFGKLKWGFINTKGELVIEHKFSNRPSVFSEGLALVRPLSQNQFDYVYIDKTGKEVIYIRKDEKCTYTPQLMNHRRTVSSFVYDDYIHLQERSFFRGGVAFWSQSCYPKKSRLMILNKDGKMYCFDEKLAENSQVRFYVNNSDVINNLMKIIVDYGKEERIVNLQGETIVCTSNKTGQTGTIHGLFDPISNLTLATIKNNNITKRGYINQKGEMIMTVKEKDLW